MYTESRHWLSSLSPSTVTADTHGYQIAELRIASLQERQHILVPLNAQPSYVHLNLSFPAKRPPEPSRNRACSPSTFGRNAQAPLRDFPCDFSRMRECDALGDARKCSSRANGCAEPHCGNRIIEMSTISLTHYRKKKIRILNFSTITQSRKIARKNA